MMSEYNGWTNYETWLTALWIDNDQWMYEYSRERAREFVGDDTLTPRERELDMADWLKEWIDSEDSPFGPIPENGPWADFINAALSEVNWVEIAEHYIAEVQE